MAMDSISSELMSLSGGGGDGGGEDGGEAGGDGGNDPGGLLIIDDLLTLGTFKFAFSATFEFVVSVGILIADVAGFDTFNPADKDPNADSNDGPDCLPALGFVSVLPFILDGTATGSRPAALALDFGIFAGGAESTTGGGGGKSSSSSAKPVAFT